MDEKTTKQWRNMLRKMFDRWHERTLKRVEKIIKEWEEEDE